MPFDTSRLGIFPLHPIVNGACTCHLGKDCERIGKHPATNWSDVQPGENHLPEGHSDGVGLRTGEEFGFFVLDYDVKPEEGKDGRKTLANWPEMPETYKVKRGQGGHFYFRYPEDVWIGSSTNALGSGIDIRGQGGIVVAEGSPHRTGLIYEADTGTIEDIADAPAWLIEKILAVQTSDPERAVIPVVPVDLNTPKGERAFTKGAEFARKAKPAIEGQSGSAWTFNVCQFLTRRFELDAETTFTLLNEYWNPRCDPPWSEKDLARKIDEAITKGQMPPGDPAERWQEQMAVLRAKLETPVAGEPVRAKAPTPEKDMNVMLVLGSCVEISSRVKEYLRPIVYTNGKFFLYDKATGVWVSGGVGRKIQQSIALFDGIEISTQVLTNKSKTFKVDMRDVRGVHDYLAVDCEIPEFFERNTVGLACNNGFVTLDRGKVLLEPHAPENRALIHHHFDFEAEAPAPHWDAFLAGIFQGDPDAQSKQQFIEEFFGACLFGLATQFQKAAVLVGEGSNGKSALLQIIQQVFPEGSISNYSPQQLTHEYARARLVGKFLNCISETPASEIADTSFLKSIVTGDSSSARDPYGKMFEFCPRAGHAFAANRLPSINDQTRGFWRKFVMVGFNRNFENDTNRNYNIVETVLQDRAGIVARLAKAAAALSIRKTYTEPESHKRILDGWRMSSDLVARYLEELCTSTDGQGLKLNPLYESFSNWCISSGEKPITRSQLALRLTELKRPPHTLLFKSMKPKTSTTNVN